MNNYQLSQNDIEKSIKTIDSPIHEFKKLLDFYSTFEKDINFNVEVVGLKKLKEWKFDKAQNFVHKSGRFFKVKRIKNINFESGILDQSEIGVLAVFCTYINNILHFLVQFKAEPGNYNNAQISPTIQATRSNYSKVHGGKTPPYWLELKSTNSNQIIFDSLQPEQGNRYWQKYNRNMLIFTKQLEEINNFKWMTLGQIYKFASKESSINSCLRSVLSLIYLSNKELKLDCDIRNITSEINNLSEESKGENWIENGVKKFYDSLSDSLIFKDSKNYFQIIGIKANIENREINEWYQPIILEQNKFNYSLFRINLNNKNYYLWKPFKQPGSVFGYFYGPTVLDYNNISETEKLVSVFEKTFDIKLSTDVLMSEEGGRFYKNVARHRIYDINVKNLNELSKEYEIFDENETLILLEQRLLSMEARSIYFFSKNSGGF